MTQEFLVSPQTAMTTNQVAKIGIDQLQLVRHFIKERDISSCLRVMMSCISDPLTDLKNVLGRFTKGSLDLVKRKPRCEFRRLDLLTSLEELSVKLRALIERRVTIQGLDDVGNKPQRSVQWLGEI